MQEKEKTEISYSAFMEILKERLQEHYGSGYVLEECGVVRNNDITRAGLIIRKSGNSFALVFHTEAYYEQYRNGEILDNVMKRIICLQKQYEEEGEIGMSVTDGQLWDFEQNRDKICVRLVNAKRNEHNLQVYVHEKFLDLALEYYVVCYVNEDGMGTVRIPKSVFETWACSMEELREIAIQNTQRILPVELLSLNGMMEKLMTGKTSQAFDGALVVLTNQKGIFGAVAMLYPRVLREYIKEHETGSKLIILPSSIHEILIMNTACNRMGISELQEMVKEINMSYVSFTEVLSDSVYCYDLESDSITCLSEDNSEKRS